MKRVLTYLKPYTALVILAMCLICAVSLGELTQPTLMSNIVNVGLQNGGIEEEYPAVLSPDGMDFLTTFMLPEDGTAFREAYVRSGEGLYERAAEGRAEDDWLAQTYGQTCFFIVQEGMTLLREMGLMPEEPQGDMAAMDMSQLYGLGKLFAGNPLLPEMLREAKLPELDPGIYTRVSTPMLKLFYQEAGVDINAKQQNYIYRVGLQMVILALACGLCSMLVGLLSARVSAGFSRDLRRGVFTKVQRFSKAEIDRFSIASLITRSTNDVQQVQNAVLMGIRMMVMAPVMGVGGLIMALRKSVSLGWIIALALLILAGTLVLALVVVMPKFRSLQGLIDKLNLVSRESLTGLMVVRAFGNEDYEEARFAAAAGKYAKTDRFVNRSMAALMPFLMTVLLNGLNMMIVWFGAKAIENSTLQIGDMMAFMQYAMYIIFSFMFVAMMFVMLPRAGVSIGRIKEVLETEISIEDPETPKAFPAGDAQVEFRHVHFRYGGAEEDVLRDISFTAKPGETTAFIGATGSGKTALINLLERFYDVTGGAILINGVDLREMKQSELRRQIGYVPQQAVLFSGSIRSNVDYGSGEAAADEAVRAAIATAQAEDFVSEQAEGLEAHVAQSGANLSGGQKQRLSIARALARQPKIYIFDDSFSALDFKTDAALRRALKEQTAGATVFIVAQRVSTILSAEQIVVLDEGGIAGIGNHQDLLQRCAVYREIAESQLSKEELQ